MAERKSDGTIVMSMGQKIAVTVLGSLLVANIYFSIGTAAQLADLRGDVRVMANENKHLRILIGTQMEDRYRGEQATADFALRDERTSALVKRVDVLERRVSALPGGD